MGLSCIRGPERGRLTSLRNTAPRRLGHDHGEDPAEAIDATGIFLGDASMSAGALAQDLNRCRSSRQPITRSR
jgi:hypothetical protein